MKTLTDSFKKFLCYIGWHNYFVFGEARVNGTRFHGLQCKWCESVKVKIDKFEKVRYDN